MKTDTKQRILAYIREKGQVSAKDTIAFLGFTPQAVFRHLKELITANEIIKIGKAPKVLYSAGPFGWASSKAPFDPPAEFYCPTSDVWQGRFCRLAPALLKKGFDANPSSLIASAVGEIGDNCFAHNAPNWFDVRGCWFEFEAKENNLRCVIVDRGRGIFDSLRSVVPNLKDSPAALAISLTKQITGRAPEQRGNGLKYVMNVFSQINSGTFVLQSGDARFSSDLPIDPKAIINSITPASRPIRGVYCELTCQLKYANGY